MKNKFKSRKDGVTEVYLNRQLVTLVDTEDLPKLRLYPNRWIAVPSLTTDTYYVQQVFVVDGVKRFASLQRAIMEPDGNHQVHHRNHDGLDNRKSNLAVVTKAVNQLLRRRKNPRNTSGFRGVSFHKSSGKWMASVGCTESGTRNKTLGYFDSPEKASRVVQAHIKARVHGAE